MAPASILVAMILTATHALAADDASGCLSAMSPWIEEGVRWHKAPTSSMKYAKATLVNFVNEGPMILVKGTVNRLGAIYALSKGDGLSEYGGFWQREGNTIAVEYRFRGTSSGRTTRENEVERKTVEIHAGLGCAKARLRLGDLWFVPVHLNQDDLRAFLLPAIPPRK